MSRQSAALESILGKLTDEHLGTDLVSAGIAKVTAEGEISLTYPYPGLSAARSAATRIKEEAAQAGMPEPRVASRTQITGRVVHGGAQRIDGVRNIIAVASAKGGVGKSAVAANLALALACEGASTGLLDADIYGPSVPVMLGGSEPGSDADNRLLPLERHGIKTLSIGHLIEPGQAVVWRGPMVVRALDQLLRETVWGELDYLVLDMPPGTGDIQLSVAQKAPVTGALLVTTPQELSFADALRGLNMFKKVSIPVLGFVENMTSFTCPDCGTKHRLFGTGAGAKLTNDHGLRKLLDLPFDPRIRAEADSGTPTVAARPDSAVSLEFRKLAARTGAAIALLTADRSMAFPKIVVSDD